MNNVYESAKILTNVQTFQDCALHQWNVRYDLHHDSTLSMCALENAGLEQPPVSDS